MVDLEIGGSTIGITRKGCFCFAVDQVETIGDAYMVVSGAPENEVNHAERVCDMALDMVDAITDLKDPSTGKSNSIHTNSLFHAVALEYSLKMKMSDSMT